MKTKVIKYGKTLEVTVLSASRSLISVVAEDGGCYLLMGHGMTELPNKEDKGWIVFEKGGAMGGYWKYYFTNPKY